eukprot:SAG25_NODE_512_length_7283_cov_3.695573_4_plen_80_part_00
MYGRRGGGGGGGGTQQRCCPLGAPGRCPSSRTAAGATFWSLQRAGGYVPEQGEGGFFSGLLCVPFFRQPHPARHGAPAA